MRKHGGTPSGRDKHVTLAAISPLGVARGRLVGGQQSGLPGCKPPPLFTRGSSSCSSQGRRQGEPWGASPGPSATTYLPARSCVRWRGPFLRCVPAASCSHMGGVSLFLHARCGVGRLHCPPSRLPVLAHARVAVVFPAGMSLWWVVWPGASSRLSSPCGCCTLVGQWPVRLGKGQGVALPAGLLRQPVLLCALGSEGVGLPAFGRSLAVSGFNVLLARGCFCGSPGLCVGLGGCVWFFWPPDRSARCGGVQGGGVALSGAR